MNTSEITRIPTGTVAASVPRQAGRRRLARLLAAVVAACSVLAGLLLGAAPAQAVTAVFQSGTPGSSTINRYETTASEASHWLNGTYYTARVFSTNGSTVYRSRATSGVQTVRVQYYLQTFTSGAWRNVAITPATYTGTFSGSTTALTTPYWSTEPPQAISRAGYRFIYSITWFDAAGRQIGYMDVGPSTSVDTRCLTTQRICNAYTDGVVV